MSISSTEVIKEIKAEARKVGLVFRKSYYSNLYCFHDFRTKQVQLKDWNLGVAYENVWSGYIASYDKDTQTFNLNLHTDYLD